MGVPLARLRRDLKRHPAEDPSVARDARAAAEPAGARLRGLTSAKERPGPRTDHAPRMAGRRPRLLLLHRRRCRRGPTCDGQGPESPQCAGEPRGGGRSIDRAAPLRRADRTRGRPLPKGRAASTEPIGGTPARFSPRPDANEAGRAVSRSLDSINDVQNALSTVLRTLAHFLTCIHPLSHVLRP